MNNTIDQLSSRLKNSSDEIREEAAFELAQIASEHLENLVRPLIDHLNDPNLEVQKWIIYGLGQTKSEEAIDPLIKFLKDPDFEVRWVTVDALREIGCLEKAIPHLIACLKQEEVWNVRVSIVKSLANIGSEEVIKTLIELIQNDENDFVQREAVYALRNLNLSFNLQLQSNQKQHGTILDYLKDGINNLVEQLPNWKLVEPGFATMGNNDEDDPNTEDRYLSRELQIDGKKYQLKIDYVEGDDNNPICRFQLTAKKQYEMIPKGFKIRLLTETLEDVDNNVKEAEQTQSILEIQVKLEPGERIAWEIEPTPDNFKTEILPPFWNS